MGHARAPQPGDTIDQKYTLLRIIGTGGMGVVFEAEHLRLKQRCAIKMLSPEMLGQAEIVHRFEREARASALLKGAHVTRIRDVATTPEGLPYIVMELLSGDDLDSVLQARGRLPYAEAVDYMLQACTAIAEAHGAGIIHRDLKPGNLFVAHTHEGVLVKVLDFGISKILAEASNLTTANMTMGTALYMSPEQLRSAAKVDARSDIWSLGVILYELLCGEPPFIGSGPQVAVAIVSEDPQDLATRCAIPPALSAVVHRALRRAPAERFASVAELATALAAFAPVGSVGHAGVLPMTRRSSPDLLLEPSMSERHIDVSAPTVAREVATGEAHQVATAANRESVSRRVPIALAALVAIVAATVAVFAMRSTSPAAGARLPEASATVTPSEVTSATSLADAAVAPATSGTPELATSVGALGSGTRPHGTASGVPARPVSRPTVPSAHPVRPAPTAPTEQVNPLILIDPPRQR